jgi:hypothetical protein
LGIFDGVEQVEAVHPFTATFPDRLRLVGPRADRVRDLLSEWVEAECPAGVVGTIGGRLLNQDDPIGSTATFYELLIGRVLRKLYGNAQWEPQGLPCSGNPDWSATIDGTQAVFEVRTLNEDMPASERRGQALFRRLSMVHAPWAISINWEECENLQSARIGQLATHVETRLARLQPGTGPHAVEISPHGARLVLTAFAMAKARSIIQSKARVEWSPGVESIRTAVRKKGSKYAGLSEAGIPYIVVICSDHPLLDPESLCTALFGDQVVKVLLPPGQQPFIAATTLNDAGCLTPTGTGPAPYTRISAVWLITCSFTGNEWNEWVTNAPNPWAANPLVWTDPRIATIAYATDPSGVEFDVPMSQWAGLLVD